MVEYQKAKRSLKAGKSSGDDGIVPDLLKSVTIETTRMALGKKDKLYNKF
jgi:hypothetical protein